MEKGWLEWIAFGLMLVGGLDWCFYSLGYDLVEMIIGSGAVTNVFYVLIGLATLYIGYLFVTD